MINYYKEIKFILSFSVKPEVQKTIDDILDECNIIVRDRKYYPHNVRCICFAMEENYKKMYDILDKSEELVVRLYRQV